MTFLNTRIIILRNCLNICLETCIIISYIIFNMLIYNSIRFYCVYEHVNGQVPEIQFGKAGYNNNDNK